MKSEARLFAVIGVFVTVPALLAVSVLLNGWALSLMWGWFIAPVFDVVPLTFGHAIGVSMVTSYMTYQYIKKAKEEKADFVEEFVEAFLIAVFRPLLYVGYGLIIHSIFF